MSNRLRHFEVRAVATSAPAVSAPEVSAGRAGAFGWWRNFLVPCVLGLGVALFAAPAHAGKQQYEPLAASVRSALSAALNDREPPEPRFASVNERIDWLASMSQRLPRRWKPDLQQRVEFLKTVRYESARAGLDPQLVLGLIEVESNFRRYAVSSAGARGYMQVMPFWSELIGDGDAAKLFDLRSNLRYGCLILRHYLDIEKGDLYRALGRYNGSLGRPEYPTAVLSAARRWQYQAAQQQAQAAPAAVANAGVNEGANNGANKGASAVRIAVSAPH